jgi:hypothetical protein
MGASVNLARFPKHLLWLALALAGCSRSEAPEASPPVPCPEVDAGTPVDQVLVAFLGKARSAHHSADLLEERHDLNGAVKVLEGLLGGRSIPARPEAREVQADTRARLADLKSQLGRFDEATREVESGLQLVEGTTYYRGHLFEVKGLVAEREAKRFKAEGDEVRAKRAEQEALDAFEKSMQVQEQVIEKALPDAGTP